MDTNNDSNEFACHPTITIIVVVKNNKIGLRKTLLSLSDQSLQKFNVIIIDGQSTDGTLDYVSEYIDTFQSLKIISEPDRNVYHAMNKGVNLSNDQFLIFLNSGDIFFSNETYNIISLAIINDNSHHDVYYGNSVIRFPYCDEFRDCDIFSNRFIHQSIVYKRSLHSLHGLYIDSPPLTISDYIFFKNLNPLSFKKINEAISINESGGISDSIKSFRQFIFFNYLYGDISFYRMLCIFTLHPFYKTAKQILSRIPKWNH